MYFLFFYYALDAAGTCKYLDAKIGDTLVPNHVSASMMTS